MMNIRKAVVEDIASLERAAKGIARAKEADYFARSLKERAVYVAESAGAVAGYAVIDWKPVYAGFRARGIPEIQDVNVLPEFRGQGVARALIAHCEAIVKEAGKTEVGISVGLYPAYGAAQKLYVRQGYIPDGAGIAYDDIPVRGGEMRAVDDLLTLKMVKSIQ